MPVRPAARKSKPVSPIDEIVGKAGQFVTSFVKGEMTQYIEAFNGALAPWLKVFTLEAVPKIKRGMQFGHPCECANESGGVRSACAHTAAVACEACGRKSCLYHSFMAYRGEAICWHCVAEAIKMSAFPSGHDVRNGNGRPRSDQYKAKIEAEIARCLNILGLEAGASWDDVHKAFRDKSAKEHPDRFPAGERHTAEERFKAVSAAYNFLKEIGYGKS